MNGKLYSFGYFAGAVPISKLRSGIALRKLSHQWSLSHRDRNPFDSKTAKKER